MLKILYLGVGDPLAPCSGMDRVCRAHLLELFDAAELHVEAIVVSPPNGSNHAVANGVQQLHGHAFQHYIGDLRHEQPGWRQRAHKWRLLLQHVVPVMAYAFRSQAAALQIARRLAERDIDLVLIDHYYALTNIRFTQLLRGRFKVIYISHDAMSPHIRELAIALRSRTKRVYYWFEALRALINERRLFAKADLVVHLSEFECARMHAPRGRHMALLPPLYPCAEDEAPVPDGKGAYRNAVVFIGSPSHPPNAQAIEWIVAQLAPALLKESPHLEIALVGQGTESFDQRWPNVRGHGFLDEKHMHDMLRQCVASICPVEIGWGIKVKVLEALAAGCPIFATAHSLRGIEPLGLVPAMDCGQPDQLARDLRQLAASPQSRERSRQQARLRWRQFLAARRHQLVRAVCALAS